MGVINWLQSYLIIIMLFVASMCVINPYTEFEMKKIFTLIKILCHNWD